jgi:hypothetical protein
VAYNVRRLGEGGGNTTVVAGYKLSFSHDIFYGVTPPLAPNRSLAAGVFTVSCGSLSMLGAAPFMPNESVQEQHLWQSTNNMITIINPAQPNSIGSSNIRTNVIFACLGLAAKIVIHICFDKHIV